jgi:hypothetical protein
MFATSPPNEKELLEFLESGMTTEEMQDLLRGE